MNIKLKDCPFCGGAGSIYVHEGANMKIGCHACDFSFSKCYAPDGGPVPADEFYKVRDELIEKWNNRAASINTEVDMNALSVKFATRLKNMDLHPWIESKAISADTVRHMYDANWLNVVGMLEILQLILPEAEYKKYAQSYEEVKERTQKEVDEYTLAESRINIQNEVIDESTTNSAEDFAAGWDWIATTENYMCDNCKEISSEPHKYCPNCKQFMRNYNTIK